MPCEKRFTCSEHDRRVAVVGATDDGGNDHRAVGQLVLLPTVQEGNLGVLLLFRDVEAFKAHLKERERRNDLYTVINSFKRHHLANKGSLVLEDLLCIFMCYLLIKTTLEVFFHAAYCHSVLRPLRSTNIRHDGAQVDLDHLYGEQ